MLLAVAEAYLTPAFLGTALLHAGLAFAFGILLKVSDLLQEHGFRWFRGADLACGAVATALILALLLHGNDGTRLFWLAVVLHWILRGRIDGVNHGIFAAAMLLYLLLLAPPPPARSGELAILFGVLAGLGLIHDLLQYTETASPRAVRWFFANQHLYWYAVALGSLAFPPHDPLRAVEIVAFVKGYGWYYREARWSQLRRLGIRQGEP